MKPENASSCKPVGVGLVGARAGESSGSRGLFPSSCGLELVAFSDEGSQEARAASRQVKYYQDYNLLLRDGSVELVLVDGPVETRADFAIRALRAGKHVVVNFPFCDNSADAVRIAKTARKQGLLATCEFSQREEPSFLAVRRALQHEDLGPPYGLYSHWQCKEEQRELLAGKSMLEQVGMGLLDQVRVLLKGEIESVRAHLHCPMPNRAEDSFLIYIALRDGTWALLHAALHPLAQMPRWVLAAPGGTVSSQGEDAVVKVGQDTRAYNPPSEIPGFWTNVCQVIRNGAAPQCPAFEIARAMKLWEAALESAEGGGPVTL